MELVLSPCKSWRGWPVAICFVLAGVALGAEPAQVSPEPLAKEIDRRIEAFWKQSAVTPAPEADEFTLWRRLYLDLNGRIPRRDEWEALAQTKGAVDERYAAAVRSLLAGPEFSLHWGAELDQFIQGDYAGNGEFVDYLRSRLHAGAAWDAIFRELLLGPWETAEQRPAQRFLDVRAKDVDRLTTDATRVFFGVDISCARCHDHPLVDDWKQDHYYGMVSFFHRTTGGKGKVSEKTDGAVTFRTALGEQKTASVMFLTGTIVAPAEGESKQSATASRRRQLVEAALAEPRFLSRAVVNRIWASLLGRGLVEPVDQLHSGNAPSVPGLLEFLADDFVASGYNLKRLIGAVVLSKPYRLAGRTANSALPNPANFAAFPLRHLSRRQFGLSLLIATGHDAFGPSDAIFSRAEKISGAAGVLRMTQYLQTEAKLPSFQQGLDPGRDGQSSAAEALFVSNNPQIQKWFLAEGDSLASQLSSEQQLPALVQRAVRTVLSRPLADDQSAELVRFVESHPDRKQACQELLWALAASAEFRFQH